MTTTIFKSESYDEFEEETRVSLDDSGALAISYWYRRDGGEWRSWQDMGASLTPPEVRRLYDLLAERGAGSALATLADRVSALREWARGQIAECIRRASDHHTYSLATRLAFRHEAHTLEHVLRILDGEDGEGR